VGADDVETKITLEDEVSGALSSADIGTSRPASGKTAAKLLDSADAPQALIAVPRTVWLSQKPAKLGFATTRPRAQWV
jgi:hypothetical protein